ncbi:MAG: hypothetical protein MRQ09_06915, partial [Candidatus Midichloria sp.]|nr:hypothetical protein [Candidatus Midichloria sp.]
VLAYPKYAGEHKQVPRYLTISGWMDGWMNTAEPFESGGGLRHLAIFCFNNYNQTELSFYYYIA